MKSNTYIFKIFMLLIFLFITSAAYNQQQTSVEVKQMTKDQILNMTYAQLLSLPFEDLINLANIMGVSAEDLLQMILNKDVSSASKTKEKVIQSPLSTTVISKEELEKSGATSIAEALRLVPGMVVREKTPGNFDIHIRGNDNIPSKNMYFYSEDALSLVMIDNRPVYNYSFGGTYWESLPVDINDVERIEVIRGAVSALYGPNAVAGVINIITKHPESNKLAVNTNIQYGTQNTTIANVGISGGKDKFKFRTSANYQHRERFQNDYYVFDLNKYVTYDQLDTLHNYWSTVPHQDTTLAEENLKDRILNSRLASDKYAANAFLFYDLNKDINFSFTTGFQRSEIVSTTLGNHTIPLTGRQSHTQYFDFKSKVYGFDFQTNYMYGNQQYERGIPAWHISPHIFNSQLEYQYKIGTLTLRPGVSYQNTLYTDKDYVNKDANKSVKDEGFLNGDKVLSSAAGFLRADYKPFEKLRLIAALRLDKYSLPAKSYLTYQFVSTYNVNENNVIRAVYSRANRGPFIVDNHSDYHWKIVPGYYELKWQGNQKMNLPVMDMFEVGFRTKIFDRIMVDIEGFRNVMKDYSYFKPDSMTLTADWSKVLAGMAKAPDTKITGLIKYDNFALQSTQIGLTCNISVVINSKLNFRVFGTLQETKLKSFYPKTIWDDFGNMINVDVAAIQTDGGKMAGGDIALIGSLMANGYKKDYTTGNVISNSSLVDQYHKSTPSFFGGASVDYAPCNKLTIFTTAYFYSKQTIELNKIDVTNGAAPGNMFKEDASYMYKVNPKFILDAKVAYTFWKSNQVFVNARNLINNDKKEFAYTDKIGGTYLVGVSLNF